LRRLLVQVGADVTLHWVKAGHGLTPADIEAARAWLQEWAAARCDRAPGHGAKGRQI
jgi:predicted esterase